METNQFEQFTSTDFNAATVGTLARNVSNQPVQAAEVSEVTSLRPQNLVRRDATRYIVMAGDLMTEATKQNFKQIEGSQLGGQWFPTTEIPCLWKFQGLVTRGRITPVINKPVQTWSDERADKKKGADIAEVQTGGISRPAQLPMHDAEGNRLKISPNVYRPEFAYDSVQSLLMDGRSPYANMGFVEVPALEGVDWATQTAQDIQTFLFRDWNEIVAGVKSLPFLLDDFVALIADRRRATNESAIIAVADAFLESANKFRGYATATVTESKRLAARSVTNQGYSMEVSPYARFLALQIGMEVEAPSVARTIAMMNQPPAAPMQSIAPVGMNAEELHLKEREIALREEELLIEKIKLGILPNPANNAEQSAGSERIALVADEIAVALKCAATTANGEQCAKDAVRGSLYCNHPAHQKMAAIE